MNKKFL